MVSLVLKTIPMKDLELQTLYSARIKFLNTHTALQKTSYPISIWNFIGKAFNSFQNMEHWKLPVFKHGIWQVRAINFCLDYYFCFFKQHLFFFFMKKKKKGWLVFFSCTILTWLRLLYNPDHVVCFDDWIFLKLSKTQLVVNWNLTDSLKSPL